MPSHPSIPQPVFQSQPIRTYSGQPGDYMDVPHSAALALASGTISLSFNAAVLYGDRAIFAKDGAGMGDGGHLSVWIKDGTLVIVQQSTTETEWLKVPELVLAANTTYHLAVTFGSDGLMVWLNGELVAAEPEFRQGLQNNDLGLVIAGGRSWREDDSQDAHSLFQGEIGHVAVYDRQLGESAMLALTEAVDPALDNPARMAAMMEDLLPVLGDIHHGSDVLKAIMAGYGATEHGHLTAMPAMRMGTGAADTMAGTAGADGLIGGHGNDAIDGAGGDDILQGGYGNDILTGGAGRDILDGGHGEDRLDGGAGDDLLISRADGREGAIYHDPGRDEGDPLNELTNGKLYPDQPVPSDDVLTGGAGADIFYFQTLINAKERYIEKHTRDDGSINWHGVAGENDKLHDHWVDIISTFDTVMDFNRAEGDRIVIEGHTTQIAGITYGDVNGDGIIDHSVIELYSDQGSGGGAHNDDRLGSIRVYGDLVTRTDIEHTAAPAYGIVHTIDDLAEALAPETNGTDAPASAPPAILPLADGLNIAGLPVPVFGAPGTHSFSTDGRAALIFDHGKALELARGTIAFHFEADALTGYQVLFSKDAEGFGGGGHITVYMNAGGDLIVRLQDAGKDHYLKAQGLIETGRGYDFAISFGDLGVEMSLDGQRVALDREIGFDLSGNAEHMVVGASGASNTPGAADKVHSHFNGTISDVVVFDRQITAAELRAAGFGGGEAGSLGRTGAPTGVVELTGTDAADTIHGTSGDDRIVAEAMDADSDAISAQLYRLYQATLGRDPDLTGLMQWHAQLAGGTASLTDITERFIASAEFALRYGDVADGAFVTLLYNNVLDRAPDAAGHAGWTARLADGGLTRADVVQRFSQSEEFVLKTDLLAMQYSQALLQAEFSDDVFRLYHATLGRDPDQNGFDGWTGRLAGGMTFGDAIGGFVASREFQQKYGATDDTAFVTLLYRNVLDRAPDAAGLQGWTGRLGDQDMTREDVVAAFAQSKEFRANSTDDLVAWMRATGTDDVIDPGAGDDVMAGGIGADRFVFAPTVAPSVKTVIDLEPWDVIDLQAFGYSSFAEARAAFAQIDDDTVFTDQNVQILLKDTELSSITDDMLLV